MLTGFLITLGVILAVAFAPVLIPLVWAAVIVVFSLIVLIIVGIAKLLMLPFKK